MVLRSGVGVDASALLPGYVQIPPDDIFRVSGNALRWCQIFLTSIALEAELRECFW